MQFVPIDIVEVPIDTSQLLIGTSSWGLYLDVFWTSILDDDAKKLLASRTVLTCLRQDLHNKEEENLTKSTGVVPAKYPSKVKLENFHNSRVPKLG